MILDFCAYGRIGEFPLTKEGFNNSPRVSLVLNLIDIPILNWDRVLLTLTFWIDDQIKIVVRVLSRIFNHFSPFNLVPLEPCNISVFVCTHLNLSHRNCTARKHSNLCTSTRLYKLVQNLLTAKFFNWTAS